MVSAPGPSMPMRLSGINAISRRSETDDYIEYTVKIPKAAEIA